MLIFIRMRLAARAPPPPHFEARRFGACVCCSCWRFAKRQIEAMQFRWRNFWRFSAVLDCSLRLLAVQGSAKFDPKTLQNAWTMGPKSMKNGLEIRPKSTKMGPKSAPKATLGASLFLVTKKAPPSLRNGCHLSATWATLGVILCPAGRQGAPKIKLFGIKSH